MKNWIDGYKRVEVAGCAGSYVGRPWKIVLHTTESGPNSTDAINNLFIKNPCSSPHFCINPFTGEKVQYLPLNVSAAALQSGGGYQTNRANAIQVEIIAYANKITELTDSQLDFIGDFIYDVIDAGVEINLDNVPYFPGPQDGTIAVQNSRFRFSGRDFEYFDGVCGHVHVPFNSHYDPYNINIHRVINRAKERLNLIEKEEPLMVTPEDEEKIRRIVREEVNSAVNTLGQWEKDTRNLLRDPVVKLDDRPHQFVILATSNGVAKQWIESQEQRSAFVKAGLIADIPPRVVSDPAEKQEIRNLPTVGKEPEDF